MEHLIVADTDGTEIRDLLFSSYDYEVGKDDNSFRIDIKRSEFEFIPNRARLFIPGTEYGGLFRRLETNTEQDTISPGGITWRGMMRKKIIVPPSGQDYATDSGELNSIVKARVEAALPGLFVGSDESTGVTVSFQYDRYCTLEEGLTKLLKAVGYRLDIAYSQTEKAVVVSAVPIVNYATDIQFSSDMRLNYHMHMEGDSVNHLICLGSGELANRTVYHLYLDEDGNIGTTQYYTGINEITEIYDYAGASLSDLIQSGKEHFMSLIHNNTFSITVEPDMELAIGDIVGGKDYLSGMTMTAPVGGKIVRWENGFRTIEYIIENDIEASV